MTFRGRHQFDIVSELIDMQLEDIAGDILSNLSDTDMSSAVLANPKWSAVATGRERVKTLFSRNKRKTAPLKTFFRREELLAQQTQDSIDARSLFMEACTKLSNLDKSIINGMGNQGDFRLMSPVDFSVECQTITITEDFIVVVSTDPENSPEDSLLDQEIYLIQLFDRWTFQLLNSLSTRCSMVFVFAGINAVVMHNCLQRKKIVFLWHFTTGKLHAIPCAFPTLLYRTLSVSKLIIVLCLADVEDIYATVYKVHLGADNIITCIVEREPMPFMEFGYLPSCAEHVNFFIMCSATFSDDHVVQVRSKEDFSLLRTVRHLTGLLRQHSTYGYEFMFSECFTFATRFNEPFIDVVSLATADLRAVYRFHVPEEIRTGPRRACLTERAEGRFLVLYTCSVAVWNIAIWKLPPDFFETCHRHSIDKTAGITSQCDELIEAKFDDDVFFLDHRCAIRVDRFGIFSCYVRPKEPSVAHFAMLNSIISDG